MIFDVYVSILIVVRIFENTIVELFYYNLIFGPIFNIQ